MLILYIPTSFQLFQRQYFNLYKSIDMKSFLFFVFQFIFLLGIAAQQSTKPFQSKDSTYNENIKKSKLYGIYIPRDIDDAMAKLMELTTPEGREPFKAVDEETVAKKLYFGLGRWMEYNWNFDEGSRFSHYLRQKGLTYTEDMTRTLLILFHRQVVGNPLDADTLIKKMVDERKKKIESEKQKQTIIHTETKEKSKN